MAIRMLEPTTPEVRHLREIIEQARWDATTQLTGAKNSELSGDDALNQILKVIPLLPLVADEENRIKQHFAPYRHLLRFRKPSARLEVIRNISNTTQRGIALEELIVEMIESSPGLRVLDVRHKNANEEIDIIVSSSGNDSMLSYWGPVLS